MFFVGSHLTIQTDNQVQFESTMNINGVKIGLTHGHLVSQYQTETYMLGVTMGGSRGPHWDKEQHGRRYIGVWSHSQIIRETTIWGQWTFIKSWFFFFFYHQEVVLGLGLYMNRLLTYMTCRKCNPSFMILDLTVRGNVSVFTYELVDRDININRYDVSLQ